MEETLPRLTATADPPESARGEVIGRYVVISTLGTGGMGVVHAAYDPELDRKVALKLLRPGGKGSRASEGRQRLLREAQAMARLSHPNVVSVHDVGEVGGEVFVAMEFVEGETLGEWLDDTRQWREVLEVFLGAGRGLAAAHAEGLVHRDFKPDNVMVADGGRVLVMDFGLARAVADPTSPRPGVTPSVQPSTDALGSDVTRHGSVIGTPAYMAPEQHHGRDVGPAADQFSFCVALYEGLYGQRPFEGASPAQLAFHVTRGRVREPPRRSGVPAWVRRAVMRGLAVDPDHRFGAMNELLAALAADPTRRNRIVGGLAGLVLVAAAAVGGARVVENAAVDRCEEQAAAIDAEWDAQRRDALLAKRGSGEAGHPLQVVEHTVRTLDELRQAWTEARRGACMAATVSGAMTQVAHDKVVECLEERRAELRELVAILTSDAPESHTLWLGDIDFLSPASECSDPARVAARKISGGPRDGLARATAQLAVRDHGAATVQARAELDAATAAGDKQHEAMARVMLGAAAMLRSDPPAAHAEVIAAYHLAGSIGLDSLAAKAADDLTKIVGKELGDTTRGLAWGRAAQMWQDRIGLPNDDVDRASLLYNLGMVYQVASEFDLAREHLERSHAMYERVLGPEHTITLRPLAALAGLAMQQADIDGAVKTFEHVLAVRERIFGADHPMVSSALSNLAIAYERRNEHDEARALLQRADRILAETVPQRSDMRAGLLNNLGIIEYSAGNYEKAADLSRRALALRRDMYGPEHIDVAAGLNNLANSLYYLGDYDGALSNYTEAARIQERALGPRNVELARYLSNLGDTQLVLGAHEDALASYERAVRIGREVLREDHPAIGYSLHGVGKALRAAGRVKQAASAFEEALAVLDQPGAGTESRILARLELAQVLWETPSDRPRALEVGREARRLAQAAIPPLPTSLARVERWLASRVAVSPKP